MAGAADWLKRNSQFAAPEVEPAAETPPKASRLDDIKKLENQIPEAPSKAESAFYGAARGGTLGLSDRLAGLGSVIGNLFVPDYESALTGKMAGGKTVPVPAPVKVAEKNPYEEGRKEFLRKEKEAREINPGSYLAGELVGGALESALPIGKAFGTVAKGATAAQKVVGAAKRVGRGVAEGAISGAANAEEGEAGKGALVGAGLAAGVGAAGEGLTAAAKWAAGKGKNWLKNNILSEIAESNEAKTTPTQSAHLDKASKNIWDEVERGPDSKKIREAWLGRADQGIKKIDTLLVPLNRKRTELYQKFVDAGKNDLDLADYVRRIDERIASTNKNLEAAQLQKIRDSVIEQANRTGEFTVDSLRALTTEAQDIAASAVGGLNLHVGAEHKNFTSRIMSEELDNSIKSVIGGDKKLGEAYKEIQDLNKRFNAQLTIRKALVLRAGKENTGLGAVLKVLKPAAGGLAGGAGTIGAIAGGDEETAMQKLGYGAAGLAGGLLLPRAVRMGKQALTTTAINALRDEAVKAGPGKARAMALSLARMANRPGSAGDLESAVNPADTE